MSGVSIGSKLKEARLHKQLSLDELQQQTKIQKRYLEAIEESDFDALPGPFYVRAFIRQYATAVDLDGDEAVKMYIAESKGIKNYSSTQEDVTTSRAAMHNQNTEMRRFWQSLPAILLSLLGLMIVIIVFFITWQNQQQASLIKQPISEIVKNVSSTTQSSTATSSTISSSSTTESSESTSSEEPNLTEVVYTGEANRVVTMQATNAKNPTTISFSTTTAACWVGVYIATAENNDNGYFFQKTVQPGQAQSVEIPKDTAQVVINVGASEYLTMTVNDKPANFNPNDTGIGQRDIYLDLVYANTGTAETVAPE